MALRVVYAAFSAHISQTVMLNEGEPWDASDPVVAEHPEFFRDEPPHVRTSRPPEPGSPEPWGKPHGDELAGVEQATAAPGERRTLTPPAATRRASAT